MTTVISDWIALRDEAAAKGLLRKQGRAVVREWIPPGLPADGLIYVAQAVTGIVPDDVFCAATFCPLNVSGGAYFPAPVGLRSGLTLSHDEWMAMHRPWLERASAVWVIPGPGDAWLWSRGCFQEAQFALEHDRLLFLPEIANA
jgi:hypothetical protein